MNVGVLLFDDFETLDVFGPVEILGRLKEFYVVNFYSLDGGLIRNSHGIAIATEPLENIRTGIDIFLIPGGHGTQRAIDSNLLVATVREIALLSKFILTVCTGSALLARTGLLDNRKATSNKRAFEWATTHGPNVNWVKKSRWTVDDNYYTASGVSAGMDMTLGFLADMHGIDFARKVAFQIEYNWIEDKDNDVFFNQQS